MLERDDGISIVRDRDIKGFAGMPAPGRQVPGAQGK